MGKPSGVSPVHKASRHMSQESRERSGGPIATVNAIRDTSVLRLKNDAHASSGESPQPKPGGAGTIVGLENNPGCVGGSLLSLDSLLTPAQCAKWLKVSKRELGENTRGHNPKIPAFSLGHKTKRFHPRTILAVLAKRAGVNVETIAASYGIETKGQQ